ncbi:MAG TPA: heavy metal translocating P-type ATPase [Leptolinea sp.]
MVVQRKTCDLCNLPLPDPPVKREVNDETRLFCCEGCARVYEVAFDNHMLEAVLGQKPQIKKESLNGLISLPGESAFFTIGGMWCAGCSLAAERVLRNKPGVKGVDISFAAERGRIEYDPKIADPQKLLSDLQPLGYTALLTASSTQRQKERFQERISLQLIGAIAFGMQVMILYLVQLYPLYSLGLSSSPEVRRIQYMVWALTTPVLFFGGLTFLIGAWRAMLAKTANMDSLVSLGVLSAYFYSVYVTLTGNGEVYFDSVAMIITFILFGRYLESIGGAQARKDLNTLLQLQPEFAWRKEGDDWKKVQADILISSDIILVKPGERVPADGRVETGEGLADESMLTGESRLVVKTVGDNLYAGTVIQDTALTARVTSISGQTRLAQISNLVTQTLSSKPPIQRLADRASTYFTFGILAIAVVTFFGWLYLGYPASKAVLPAVAVLVVACPCALGLATPLALSVSISKSARKGVLVRSATAMETAALVKKIVFDKTGTLTSGDLSISAIQPLKSSESDKKQLLLLAASVEQFSDHPIAKAIISATDDRLLPANDFYTVRGSGATARVMEGENLRITIGSERLVKVDENHSLINQANLFSGEGETIVWVARETDVIGFISLRDEPNHTVKAALDQLKEENISLAVLSGDSIRATGAIARMVGIDEFTGACLPDQKANKIKEWQETGEKVGMVGDGVNDAPALVQADLSITVAGGSDIAGKTSDLVLTRRDLTLIPWFVTYSQKTRRIILENLGWAFAYNIISIPLAVMGMISPVIAAVSMAISSILVVNNSLRLR